ncbi:MAG: RNA methyltransferase [Candidatus Hodarchaeota archaeon]
MLDVALLEPKTLGNIGFIARAMKNFDMGQLIIFSPRYEFSDEIFGFAMKARDVIEEANIIVPDSITGVDILDQLGTRYDLVVGTTAKPASRKKVFRIPLEPRELGKKVLGKKCLLVFGREDTGLTDAELASCDLTVTIPTSEAYPSMNLSHAATLIFYEIFIHSRIPTVTQDSKKAQEDLVPAPRTSRQGFYDWLDATLKEDPDKMTEDWRSMNFFHAMKNVLERSDVTKRELNIISGFMKEILKGIH